MGAMVRKQIYIGTDQEARLKRVAARRKTTEAEIVREALDRILIEPDTDYRDPHAWEREREYILQLMARGPVPGRRTWVREDLHER